MKKSTKLLSVLLAVLMILSSLTVAASAAVTKYQTVANLESLAAYNTYGTVSRLSTEERCSLTLDYLDKILLEANINMGYVVNVDLWILGKIQILVDLTSIDQACKSIDSIKSTLESGLGSIAKGIMNFGIVEDLSFSTWATGMSRSGTANKTILQEVLQLLANNAGVVETAFTSGIKLGMITTMANIDLSNINEMITDLPKLIRGLIYPLFSRPDDNNATQNIYANATADLGTTLDNFVKGIFTKRMKWTSYRVDANGASTGATEPLPTTPGATTRYFVVNGNAITQWDYQFKGDDKGNWTETVTYTKSATEEPGNPGVYLYVAPDDYTGDHTLKWYTAGDEGYFVPALRDAVGNGELSFSLVGTDSVLDLIYKFAPYLFRELAVVVLNGSVKKLVAELFDVKFTKLGDKGTFTPPVNDTFFTEDQGAYVFERSGYKVIDGVPYYRLEDEFFVGEVPDNISSYYYMFDWNYEVPEDFVDEFIPAAQGSSSAAGYTRILQALNDFVGKAIDLFILDEWTLPRTGVTYTKADVFTWEAGGNDKALNNILNVARNVVSIAPVEIFGDYYQEAQFYDAMMTGTLSQAVNGAICEGVKLLMPQIIFPDNVVNQNMLAIAAVVVRELCTQLMPAYNFDALIYSDYNNRAVLEGKDQTYWLNTTVTMGIDLGIYYLRNIVDLGEDTANSYYKIMKNQGALPTNDAETQTYTADFDVSKWVNKIDWLLDWALASDEWQWKMGNLVNGGTVNISTFQDPWTKLSNILTTLIPFDNLFNVEGATASSFLEKVLRNKLVDAISNLDLPTLVSLFDIPANGYFTKGNIVNQAINLVVYILDGVFYKAYGNANLLNKNTFNTYNAFLNHSNLVAVVKALVSKLETIFITNGILDTALPFLNMFVGWKTGSQEYKDPAVVMYAGDVYFNKDADNAIRFINNSSGMLEKHRNSAADKPYNIIVKGINFDGTDIKLKNTFSETTVSPLGYVDYPVTVTATDRTAKVTVRYQYTGKDGQPLGSIQERYSYVYLTNQWDNEGDEQAEDDSDYTLRPAYKKYIFTKDLYNDVIGYEATVSYKSAAIQFGNKTKDFKSVSYGTNPGSTFSALFDLITNRTEAGWAATLYKEENSGPQATTGKLWKAKSGKTEAVVNASAYGVYDGGSVNIKYGSHNNAYAVDFIYYDDQDIGSYKSKYVGYQLTSADVTSEGQTAFNNYETALKTLVKWCDYPKQTNYVTNVQPHIQPAIEALEAAYSALKPYISKTAVDYQAQLQATLDAAEPNSRDYDFQDYQLFEYFTYEKQRTAIRELINSYKQPEAPTQYIEGESLSIDQINDIIDAQSLQTIKTGITATLKNPSQDSIDAYNSAIANWVTPVHDELYVRDTQAKVPYYQAFMFANPRPAYYNQFLTKEIAYANANYPASDEALYSPDSWAEFSSRLEDAQAVAANANAKHSEIFDAKYFLMVAMNNLNVVEHSMKDDGNNYLNEIRNLIANAEAILAHIDLYTIVDGVTRTDALAQLVQALGVRYTNDNGDAAILYDHSAYTFVDYDRVNTTKEKGKVDNAADKLKAAIDNFYVATIAEKSGDTVVTDVDSKVNTIQGIKPGAIATPDALLDHVEKLIPTASYTPYASKAGTFGTGSTVIVNVPEIGVEQIYYVVIFGDINGDNAIDAFDTYAADRAINKLDILRSAYKLAADIDANDEVELADYAVVKTAVAGTPIPGNG